MRVLRCLPIALIVLLLSPLAFSATSTAVDPPSPPIGIDSPIPRYVGPGAGQAERQLNNACLTGDSHCGPITPNLGAGTVLPARVTHGALWASDAPYSAVSELTEYDCTANGTTHLTGCSPNPTALLNAPIDVQQGAASSCTGPLATPPTVSWADFPTANGGATHTYFQVEALTIPAGSPATYTPTTTAQNRAFAYYQFHQAKNGAPLTYCSCTNPAAGQYGLSAGTFYFNTADTGKVINLGYYVTAITSWSYQIGYTTAGGSYCAPTTLATMTGPPAAFVNSVYPLLFQLSGSAPAAANGIYAMICSGASCTPSYAGWQPIMPNFSQGNLPNPTTASGTISGTNGYRYLGHPYGNLNGLTPPFNDDLLTSVTNATSTTIDLASATATTGTVKIFRDNSAAINAAEALCSVTSSNPGGSPPVMLPVGSFEIAARVGPRDGGVGCALLGMGMGDSADATALVWVGPNGGNPLYVNHSTAARIANLSVIPHPTAPRQIGFGLDVEATSPVTAGTSRNVFDHLSIGPSAVCAGFGAYGAQQNTDESQLHRIQCLGGSDAWAGEFGYADFHGQVKENVIDDRTQIHHYAYDVYTTGGITTRDTDISGGGGGSTGGIGFVVRGPSTIGPNVATEGMPKFYWDSGNIITKFIGAIRIGNPDIDCAVGDQMLFQGGTGSQLQISGLQLDESCPQELFGGSASIIADGNLVSNTNFFTPGLKNDVGAFISVNQTLIRSHGNTSRLDSGAPTAIADQNNSLGVGTPADGTTGDALIAQFLETGVAPNACVNQDASGLTNSLMSLQNNCSHSNPALALKTNAGGSNNQPGIVLGPETSGADTATDAKIYRDSSGNLVLTPKAGQYTDPTIVKPSALWAATSVSSSQAIAPVQNTIYLCDATGGAVTLTLPAATATRLSLLLKKIDSSSNACAFARAGSDTIDGATSATENVQYASMTAFDGASAKWSRLHTSLLAGDVTGLPGANTVAKVNGNTPGNNAVTHQFVTSIDSSARGTTAQPASTDLSDIPIPITSGGTGGITASAARTSLATHYLACSGSGGSNMTGGTTVQYLSLSTNGLQAGGSTTLITAPQLITGTIKNLTVSLNGALAAGSYTIAADDEANGGAQVLTCTITSPSTTCTDITHSYAWSANATLEWKVTPASAATALPLRLCAEVDM